MATGTIKPPVKYKDITISITTSSPQVIDYGNFSEGKAISVTPYYNNDWYYALITDSLYITPFITDANRIQILKRGTASATRNIKLLVAYI